MVTLFPPLWRNSLSVLERSLATAVGSCVAVAVDVAATLCSCVAAAVGGSCVAAAVGGSCVAAAVGGSCVAVTV